jgi:capsular exopolysaccharide synthesis family protein
VERLIGLPVWGYVPMMSAQQHLIRALPPYSPVVESYRGLRSSISFSSVDAPLTTLAVTSARAGEGKSTTAANLALAMAMDGRNVILVDADLRRPSLHRLLRLHSSPGLTDVLTGRCALEEAFHALSDPPLLVLPSGPIPPNPAEMLNTAAMESVIQQLRERADIVLFDTPPCLPVTDTQVLGAKLDGTLLVAEIDEVRKGELRRAHQLLDQAHIRVLGIVFNKASGHSGEHYYRSGYYSGNGTEGSRNGANGHHVETSLPRVAQRSGGSRREHLS